MGPKCPPRASGAGPEPKIGPNRVPKGGPRGAKNESKITLLRVLGGRCGTKSPQELSRYPPTAKMEPKWCQNCAKMGQKMKPQL